MLDCYLTHKDTQDMLYFRYKTEKPFKADPALSSERTIRGAARERDKIGKHTRLRYVDGGARRKKDQRRCFLVGMRSCYDRKDYELAIEIITICNQEMLRIEC